MAARESNGMGDRITFSTAWTGNLVSQSQADFNRLKQFADALATINTRMQVLSGAAAKPLNTRRTLADIQEMTRVAEGFSGIKFKGKVNPQEFAAALNIPNASEFGAWLKKSIMGGASDADKALQQFLIGRAATVEKTKKGWAAMAGGDTLKSFTGKGAKDSARAVAEKYSTPERYNPRLGVFRGLEQAQQVMERFTAATDPFGLKKGGAPMTAQTLADRVLGKSSGTEPTGAMILEIGPDRIQARLAPTGMIDLLIPADRVKGAGGAGGAGGGTGGTPTDFVEDLKKGRKGKTAGKVLDEVEGALVETVRTEFAGKKKPVLKKRFLTEIGEQVDTYLTDLDSGAREFKRVTKSKKTSAGLEKIKDTLTGVSTEIAENFGSLAAVKRDPKRAAAVFAQHAANLDAFIDANANLFKQQGLGDWVRKLGALSATLKGKSGDAMAVFESRRSVGAASFGGGDGQTTPVRTYRQQEREVDAELRAIRADIVKRAKAKADLEKLEQGQGLANIGHQRAQDVMRNLEAAGFQRTNKGASTSSGRRGDRTTQTSEFTRTEGDQLVGTRVKLHFENGKAAKADVEEFTRKIKESTAATRELGSNFVDNTVKVTKWAASVTLLYKGMELAAHSMHMILETGRQAQVLDQVFKQAGGSTRELTDDLMQLAAVNGRSTKEAIASGTEWARLGLSRAQVNEAVSVSLMAANVSEKTVAQTTDHLMQIMQAYGLRVGQLRTVVNELNHVAINYNVTNADLMDGLSRTASVAQRAGLSLQELTGLIGAMAGATGQGGVIVGNTYRNLIGNLFNPNLQQTLRKEFGVETRQGGTEMKSMSAVLGQLYERYEKLNGSMQQYLVYVLGGRMQTNRLQAMLDSYVRAQALAINMQLNLNTAEEENAKIKKALATQLAGLTAEWERFVVVQGNNGPVQVMSQMTAALKNLLTLSNTKGGSFLTTAVLGLATAGGIKALLAGMHLQDSKTFVGRTGAALARNAQGMNDAVNAIASGRMRRGNNRVGAADIIGPMPFKMEQLGVMDRAIVKMNIWGEASLMAAGRMQTTSTSAKALFGAFGVGMKALSAATALLSEFLIPLAVIGAGIYVFNHAMDSMALSSEGAMSRLAGFNAEAERAGAAAQAAAQAVELFGRAQRLLPSMRGEKREKFLDDLAGAANPWIKDEGERRKAQAGTRAGWGGLDDTRMRAALDVQIQKSSAMRISAIRDQQRAVQDAMFANAAAIKRAEDAEANSLFKSEYFTKKRRATIAELRKVQSEYQRGSVNLANEEMETNQQALESQLEHSQEYKSALARKSAVAAGISAIYATLLPAGADVVVQGETEIAMRHDQVQALQYELQLRQELNAVEDRAQSQKGSTLDDLDRETAALDAQIRALEKKAKAAAYAYENYSDQKGVNLIHGDRSGFDMVSGVFYGKGVVNPAGARSEDLDRQLEDLKWRRTGLDSRKSAAEQSLSPGYLLNMRRIQDITQTESPEAQKAEAEARAAMQAKRVQRQITWGQQSAQRDYIRADYGLTDTDKLLRQFNRLQGELGLDNRGRVLKFGGEDMALQSKSPQVRGEYAAKEQQYADTVLRLVEERAKVERDINQLTLERARELRKDLFGGGPGALLKTLAAFRTALDGKGGLRSISQGNWLAMSPGFQQSVVSAQGFGKQQWQENHPGQNFTAPKGFMLPDDSMRLLTQAAQKLDTELSGRLSNFTGVLEGSADRLSKLIAGISDSLPKTAFDAGAEALGKFNQGLGDANEAVKLFTENILKANAPTVVAGWFPKNPQAGGVGGATGYVK